MNAIFRILPTQSFHLTIPIWTKPPPLPFWDNRRPLHLHYIPWYFSSDGYILKNTTIFRTWESLATPLILANHGAPGRNTIILVCCGAFLSMMSSIIMLYVGKYSQWRKKWLPNVTLKFCKHQFSEGHD